MPMRYTGPLGFTVGIATIDFGTATQHMTDTSVVVTGQAGIRAGSLIVAQLIAATTADNDPDAHVMAAAMLSLVCGATTPGVGFTIYAVSDGGITGTFKVKWLWN